MKAGIVVDVDELPSVERGKWVYSCLAVEGNTSELGTSVGPWAHLVRRTLCPALGDRTIRWVDLDVRGGSSDPVKRVGWRRAV